MLQDFSMKLWIQTSHLRDFTGVYRTCIRLAWVGGGVGYGHRPRIPLECPKLFLRRKVLAMTHKGPPNLAPLVLLKLAMQ